MVIRLFALALLLTVAPSWAGVVRFAYNLSAHKVVKIATYPVEHPKKFKKAVWRVVF